MFLSDKYQLQTVINELEIKYNLYRKHKKTEIKIPNLSREEARMHYIQTVFIQCLVR